MKSIQLFAFSIVLVITASVPTYTAMATPTGENKQTIVASNYYINKPKELIIEGNVATIPETINNSLVTRVNLPKVVCDSSKIEELVVPSGVSEIFSEDYMELIGDNGLLPFSSITPNCPNLSKVTVSPNNIHFKSIDGVLYSKDGTTLYYCPPAKTGSLVIPEGVTTISAFAFQGCKKLTSITAPSTLKNIWKFAFGGNAYLKKINIANGNPYLKIESDVLFSADGEILYTYPAGKTDKEYTIPNDVITIQAGAFLGNTYITKVTASPSVQSVLANAFDSCTAIKSIQFTSTLLDIGAGAFINCKNVTNITFPYGTRNISNQAFDGCNKLLTLKFPSSIISLPKDLETVKNRKIYYFSPYFTGNITAKSKIAKGVITYTYKGSPAAENLKKQGTTVRYYSKSYATVSKAGKVPSGAVTGVGKSDTSWYKKSVTTFKIENPDQLAGLATLVNKGNEFKGKKIQLTKDLNLACYSNWTAIGKAPMKDGVPFYSFKGEFNGGGHTIYNLRINATKQYRAGLFGSLEGNVTNVNVEKADVLGYGNVGILSGYSSGKISNCHVSGNVRGDRYIGGLVGFASGTIASCSSSVTLHGIQYIGGLAGEFSGKELEDSYSKGYVSGLYMTGGIVGELACDGIMKNCQNYSKVKGRLAVGGIIGFAVKGDIKDISGCTNHGSVTGSTAVGGIIGNLGWEEIVDQCVNLAVITGENSIGGIVGTTALGIIKNSKNEGAVTGKSGVGGILGNLSYHYPDEYETIIDCENQGEITATRYKGDMVGREYKYE